MARIPRHRTSNPERDDPPRRAGRAGLDVLMRDPRYWEADHPDHAAMVDTVRRGFKTVFAAPKGRVPATVPYNPDAQVTDPDGPFARSLARLIGPDDDLDALPEAMRGTLGKRAILAVLKDGGHRLPPGLEEEGAEKPRLRTAAAASAETTRDGGRQAETATKAQRPEMPWHPVDENGKPIPPHPDDPRFDKDGNPKPEWFGNSSTKRWAGQNSRWNPDLDDGKGGTGGFEYYEDRPDIYYRDPKNPEQWVRKPPGARVRVPSNERKKEGSLPPVEQNDPPETPHPGPPGPPYIPVFPPFPERFPRPRRR